MEKSVSKSSVDFFEKKEAGLKSAKGDVLGSDKADAFSSAKEDISTKTKGNNIVNDESIITLAIESSCDETSCAILKNGREVLSNIISTQIDIHKKFGGVVPEVASRKHVENISIVVEDALEKAGVTMDDVDHIVVTYGPGLVGALLVGLSYAKGLSMATNKPLTGVNHIEGHICANYIQDRNLKPPFVTLVVSGGHTHIVEVLDYNKYNIIGKTKDDASGEAFDKVARAMELGYPGGPLIDKLAKEGNPHAVEFPRANMNDGYNFSFSGIKSSVLNYLNSEKMKGNEINKADVAASFQEAVTDVLCEKTIKAAMELGYDKIALAGGVACNSQLREKMKKMADENNLGLIYPSPILCTDNAAMIGTAGYYRFINKRIDGMELNAVPNLKIGD